MSKWAAFRLSWVILFLFPLLSGSSLSAADLKVRTSVRMTDDRSDEARSLRREEIVYVQGARERTEYLASGAGAQPPHSAEIFDCDSHLGYRADLNGREYMELALPPFPSREETEKKAIDEEKETRKSFDARTVDTGETKSVFGRTARHMVTIVRGKTGQPSSEATIDGWYIDLPLPGCAPSYLRQGRAIEVTAHFLISREGQLVHTGFIPPGLAVQETITTRSRFSLYGIQQEIVTMMERTVEEISDASLDPALFTVPAGFTKVEQLPPPSNLPRPVLLQR